MSEGRLLFDNGGGVSFDKFFRLCCTNLAKDLSRESSVVNGMHEQTHRRDLRRRSAIEPMIGHMKTDGRLARCILKGTLGDAVHAVLCGCGHNIRMIMAHLRAPLAQILAMLMAIFGKIIAPKPTGTAPRALLA